jgi:hypothetical protein
MTVCLLKDHQKLSFQPLFLTLRVYERESLNGFDGKFIPTSLNTSVFISDGGKNTQA